MQNKITLLIIFFVLFSLQGFSQTVQKSEHPLLDKYYPRKQNTDTNKTITTQIKPVPETKPASPITNKSVDNKPTITARVPVEEPAPETKTSPAVTDTLAVNKPTITSLAPVQKKVQPQPLPATPYIDTRLGSSSKLYDTYEKNNNGAGSVTTSPK